MRFLQNQLHRPLKGSLLESEERNIARIFTTMVAHSGSNQNSGRSQGGMRCATLDGVKQQPSITIPIFEVNPILKLTRN